MINLENFSDNISDNISTIELELKKRLEFLLSLSQKLSQKLPHEKIADFSLPKKDFSSQSEPSYQATENEPSYLATKNKLTSLKPEITKQNSTILPNTVASRGLDTPSNIKKDSDNQANNIYNLKQTDNTEIKIFTTEITNLITTEVLNRVLGGSSVAKLSDVANELPNLVKLSQFFSQNYTTINNSFSSVTNLNSKITNEEKPDYLGKTSHLTGRENYLARQKKLE